MKAGGKVALIACGAIIVGAVLLFAMVFATIHFYLESDSDYRMSFHNAAQHTISNVQVVVGGRERYETGPIAPGESVVLKLSPPQDRPLEVIALFSTGQQLSLADPVYAPAGARRMDAFVVQKDRIVLSGGEGELTDASIQAE